MMVAYIIAGVVCVVFLVIALLAVQKSKTMSNQVDELVNVVNDLTKGNYNVNIRSGNSNAIGRLESALARFVDILRKTEKADVATSSATTTRVAEHTKEISTLNTELTSATRNLQIMEEAIRDGRLSCRLEGALSPHLNAIMSAISEPVNEVSGVIKNITKGIFAQPVKGAYKGDFLALKDSVNEAVRLVESYVEEISMVGGVLSGYTSMVDDLKKTTDAIDKDTEQIMDNSQRLSDEANRQSQMVQDLNMALSHVNSQATQTAVSAEKAASLAADAMDNANVGQSEMNNMLDAIASIRESSENISRVIQVINDIARQTNLLALNAAVEAARAGAHGRGFMVVAEEVRNLANKSKQAANQTTELIADSMEKVTQGTNTAQNTAAALERVVTSVEEINAIVGDISQVADGQRVAITGLADDTDRIADVARLTADTVNGNVYAVEDLDKQLGILRHLSDSFVLGGSEGRKPAPPTRSTRTLKQPRATKPVELKPAFSTKPIELKPTLAAKPVGLKPTLTSKPVELKPTLTSRPVELKPATPIYPTRPAESVATPQKKATTNPLTSAKKTNVPSGSHEYDRKDFGKY